MTFSTWPFRVKNGILKLLRNRWAKPDQGLKPRRESSDQRSSPRFRVHPKVLAYPLRPQVSRRPYGGGVKNLSKNGVCLETPEPISNYQLFLLDFKFPGKGNVQTPARVIWSKNKISGLEFLDPSGMEEILKDSPEI